MACAVFGAWKVGEDGVFLDIRYVMILLQAIIQ